MKTTLRLLFTSFLFIAGISMSANAKESCPSMDEALETFQSISDELREQDYEVKLTPIKCGIIVHTIKRNKSLETHGFRNVRWDVKIETSALYVWMGVEKNYSFVYFEKFDIFTKAPWGAWHPASEEEAEKSKTEVANFFWDNRMVGRK